VDKAASENRNMFINSVDPVRNDRNV